MADINNISVFKDLDKEGIKELSALAREQNCIKRELIFSEGDQPDWFYAVDTGRVKITKLSQDGKEIILEIIKPGEMFGAVAALKGFPYPANAVAMEDSTLIKISRSPMLAFIEKAPGLMMSMAHSMGERLKDSHETAKNIALEKVASRIASLLIKLADQTGTKTENGMELGIKLTKQDIAEMVGSTVETSIRTMSSFKKQGYIKEEAGKIIIIDPSGLGSV